MNYEQTTAGVAESNAGGDKRSGYTLCPGSPTALALGNSLCNLAVTLVVYNSFILIW